MVLQIQHWRSSYVAPNVLTAGFRACLIIDLDRYQEGHLCVTAGYSDVQRQSMKNQDSAPKGLAAAACAVSLQAIRSNCLSDVCDEPISES